METPAVSLLVAVYLEAVYQRVIEYKMRNRG